MKTLYSDLLLGSVLQKIYRINDFYMVKNDADCKNSYAFIMTAAQWRFSLQILLFNLKIFFYNWMHYRSKTRKSDFFTPPHSASTKIIIMSNVHQNRLSQAKVKLKWAKEWKNSNKTKESEWLFFSPWWGRKSTCNTLVDQL